MEAVITSIIVKVYGEGLICTCINLGMDRAMMRFRTKIRERESLELLWEGKGQENWPCGLCWG